MRVAIFTDSWFPRIDGITTSVAATMRLMEARGHSFHIFCSGPESTRAADVTLQGIHISPIYLSKIG